MINFEENSTKVRGSTSDGISLSRRKVKIRLSLKDGKDEMVLTLTNVFFLPHSSSNLVSLGLLNNVRIFYHNKDQILYIQETQKIFTFAKRHNTSFLLHPSNLLIAAVSLFNTMIFTKAKSQIYIKHRTKSYLSPASINVLDTSILPHWKNTSSITISPLLVTLKDMSAIVAKKRKPQSDTIGHPNRGKQNPTSIFTLTL